MRRKYLTDCEPGDLIDDVFVVSGKQFSPTSNGKHFIKAFVSDRSCQVTVRMWNATCDLFNALPESGFVRLRGRIENYQNNLQCIIEQTWAAKEGSYDLADLMPQTKKDIGGMQRRIFEILKTIRNRHLQALIQAYLNDERLMQDFAKAPAAMTFHHAYIGGLLEHTLNAIEVADAVCPFYPGLSRDLIVAGIFLHDIAKTWELTYETSFGYSDGGYLVGHIVKSAIWVEHKRIEAEALLGEPIPQPLIDVVQHIILSHHGEPEFGAAKTPATPEAIFVHTIENLDAKLMMSLEVTRGEGLTGDGSWTEYMKAFSGRLYRPDVAPPEGHAAPTLEVPPSIPTTGPAAPGRPPATPPQSAPTPPAAKPVDPARMVISNPLFDTAAARRK